MKMLDTIKQNITWGAFLRFLGSALVVALVSGVVSSMVAARYGERLQEDLETKKQRMISIIQAQTDFEAAQNVMLSQLGIYTGKLIKDSKYTDNDDLLKSIIAAQLQINKLKNELKPEDEALVAQYAGQLDKLNQSLRVVHGWQDLHPVFDSVQAMLGLHDQIAERVKYDTNLNQMN